MVKREPLKQKTYKTVERIILFKQSRHYAKYVNEFKKQKSELEICLSFSEWILTDKK